MKSPSHDQNVQSPGDKDKSEKLVRRRLLRPLRRRQSKIDTEVIARVLSRFDEISQATEELPKLAAQLRRARAVLDDNTSGATKEFVCIACALYAARRISRQEYVFYSAMPVERIHEDRVMSGIYNELREVSQAIDSIEQQSKLATTDHLTQGREPNEHSRLADRWEGIYKTTFVQTLREFDLEDLAVLYEADQRTFDRLRERGRRAVFHGAEFPAILQDIIVRYEEDARKAAEAGAFSAAITLLGAGLEGLLLLRCLRSKKKAERIANRLPRRRRPMNSGLPMKWTFQNLIDVCLGAGWLPPISTALRRYDSGSLAHVLREMRNYVHPARIAQRRPWSEETKEDYRDAEAIYAALVSAVSVRQRNGKVQNARKSS